MTRNGRTSGLFAAGVALIALVACGAPGLPPTGPAPGEVDVGYGTQDADQVTGAVTSVGDDDLGNFRPMNVEELLRGRVAGLQIIPQPDGSYRFRIRGSPTVGTEQPEPLFVVDGIQISGNSLNDALAGLSREDIKQVDVLKDIASTSVYGMRGAGGVIVISTTRR